MMLTPDGNDRAKEAASEAAKHQTGERGVYRGTGSDLTNTWTWVLRNVPKSIVDAFVDELAGNGVAIIIGHESVGAFEGLVFRATTKNMQAAQHAVHRAWSKVQP